MVGNTGQLHDNDAEIVHPLGRLHPQQLLTGEMPSHIIDRRTTIVQSVSQRCYLVQRPAFRQLFKSPVDISNSLLGRDDPLPVQLQDILKYPVSSRVRRPQVERGGGLLDAAFRKLYML